MREILFRAKSNYGNVGEWEYGLVSQPHVTENGIVTSYYFTKLCEDGHSSQRTVSANTIGQYTGLTDKNGKKIFEGDICQHRSYYSDNIVISVVTYTDGQFLAMVDENSGFNLSDKLEIIGNIHDNLELLKGGAE